MKQAIIFGAGNIGRGFIGQLYSESGYEVTFVDVDRLLLDTLSERGRYTIRLVTNEQIEEVTVGSVRALHSGDLDAVAEAVSRAEIGATAVGAGILKHIAPAVAAGITRPCATWRGCAVQPDPLRKPARRGRDLPRDGAGRAAAGASRLPGRAHRFRGHRDRAHGAAADAGAASTGSQPDHRGAVQRAAGGSRRFRRRATADRRHDPLLTLRLLHRPQALHS